MDTMIELPAMRRTAELAPNTADATARTVEVVWSAGARVRRASFFGEPYDEELSLDPAHVRLERLNAGAPFLKVHELGALDAVIGSVVPGSARLENGRGIALVRISERDDVEPIWRDIQAGHIRAVSIGYQVHRFEVSKPDGGRELWRAVDWTPFEVSAVPVGADPAAGFRAQQSLHDCVLHRRDASNSRQGASPMTDPTQTPAAAAAEPHVTEETQMTTPTNTGAEPQARADRPGDDRAVAREEPPSVLDQLPGDLMMWVLIVSELLVFGAGMAAFLAVRLTDPAGFAEAQGHLHRTGAGINTVVLVTSGWFAALALQAVEAGRITRTRVLLALASALGVVFLILKGSEYADLAAAGISFETHAFFTFSYLLTGFHAAHVIAGMVILFLVGLRPSPRAVDVGAAFWHMVDLVWVLLFPVIYLL